LVFGAGDQYLGSLRPMVAFGPWTVSVSQMSALWLLLPFAFGCTQERPRPAMLVGVVATASALIGYFAMTLSPVEGVAVHRIPAVAAALLATNLLWIVGGAVTGPLFGLLGQRWRERRWWITVAVVGGAFLFEPVARYLRRELVGPSWVWVAEAIVGACFIAGFVVVGTLRPRPTDVIS
jgi:Family of unknown function (DUF6518)